MSKLLEFKAPEKDYRLSVKAESSTHAVMELYGTVGGDWFGEGILAKDVISQLKELPASIKTLDLHLNSPGGSVFEGMAIYNRLKEYSKKVKITAHVDALSASIASVIMLAANEIQMSDTGFVMIHKPWVMAAGNSDELEKTIGLLDDIENQMITLYAKKTKLSRIEIKDLLTKETWMDAAMALDLGFIDKKKEDEQKKKMAACISPNMGWLKNAPQKLVTQDAIAKKAVEELRAKVDGFINKKV